MVVKGLKDLSNNDSIEIFRVLSLKNSHLVSSTQEPGLGSGTLLKGTGNQADVLVACSYIHDS